MDLFLSVFFLCFGVKYADLSVFHFQCLELDIKDGPGLGAWLLLLLLLT